MSFEITILKERKTGRKAIELHVPGFMTWTLTPKGAAELAQELGWAAADAQEEVAPE
ncbi:MULTISPECIES: hypothetical protein [Xanthobacter]|uniref:hypothetical protein n=1 Tax=Xanthobacter TaxID=279 RepID=UPI001F1E5AA7|nr:MULTISPECIES: hypothetical protein [Xanthobacter]MCL8384145.1 hypothetical protein [Xanthobacter aminoxidans]